MKRLLKNLTGKVLFTRIQKRHILESLLTQDEISKKKKKKSPTSTLKEKKRKKSGNNKGC